MSRRFVAYYRIHNACDLGEQINCAKKHARAAGGQIIRSYRDDETHRRPERRELIKALDFTRRQQASLLIGTLKGVSRDVRFLRTLKDSAVDFIACDLAAANASTINVLTALAEYELKLASERSKKAAAAYKAEGGQLGGSRPGSRNLDQEARKKGARTAGQIARKLADQAYRELTPTIHVLREAGRTLQGIADLLNAEGFRTRRGRLWNAMQVSRVLKRSNSSTRSYE